jgi:hypothetical protein
MLPSHSEMREERAMATVRTEATDGKWKLLIILGFLIAIVGGIVMPGVAAAQSFSYSDACGVYATMLQDASFLNREEIRVRIRRVYELARGGDPKVWDASRAALTAATSGQRLSESLDGLSQACHDKGSPFFHNWQGKPSAPQTAEDADRYNRGVLERGGDPKAKCTKKQYGTGWVSVCE